MRIQFTSLMMEDQERALEAKLRGEPVDAGPVITVLFEDTCATS
jgi:hypothetical protein